MEKSGYGYLRRGCASACGVQRLFNWMFRKILGGEFYGPEKARARGVNRIIDSFSFVESAFFIQCLRVYSKT